MWTSYRKSIAWINEDKKRGAELYLVPRHVCPTVNLAESAVLIEAGDVREIAPVSIPGNARGNT